MLTKKHFEVLADELAEDKIFYNRLSYREKLNRMVKYCQSINPRFRLKTFLSRINFTYRGKILRLNAIKKGV